MTDGRRILTLPRANPINAFTMGGIVRDAGLTIEEFKKLLLTLITSVGLGNLVKALSTMRSWLVLANAPAGGASNIGP